MTNDDMISEELLLSSILVPKKRLPLSLSASEIRIHENPGHHSSLTAVTRSGDLLTTSTAEKVRNESRLEELHDMVWVNYGLLINENIVFRAKENPR